MLGSWKVAGLRSVDDAKNGSRYMKCGGRLSEHVHQKELHKLDSARIDTYDISIQTLTDSC